jgi:uncharacterized protein
MSESSQKSVDCPTCSKEVAWTETNKYRPFCSERCKLIDFGDWANERNAIAGESIYPVDEEEEDSLQ